MSEMRPTGWLRNDATFAIGYPEPLGCGDGWQPVYTKDNLAAAFRAGLEAADEALRMLKFTDVMSYEGIGFNRGIDAASTAILAIPVPGEGGGDG